MAVGFIKLIRRVLRQAVPYLQILLRSMLKVRFFFCIFLGSLVLLLSQAIRDATGDIQRFYCFGPAVPPMDLTPEETRHWYGHQHTPVLFNHHAPIEVTESTITGIDLNAITTSKDAASNKERILILTPLRDASLYLPKHFDLILELTYPHELIDLAFIVGDSHDETLALLSTEVNRIQRGKRAFRSVQIIQKNFGQQFSQNDVNERHSFTAQAARRKAMARARNQLLYTALKPEHSWVFWRDVDVVDSPATILEDFIKHDKDIVVPNVWFHRYVDGKDIEGRFDYNSWQESPESFELAKTLDKDVILAEGYKEYNTNRRYMAPMGSRTDSRDEEIPLDGIGGVSILVKADVHRSGINFPCYAFENQAETEGFAKMAKRAGYEVVGLPNYVVWHIDTGEVTENTNHDDPGWGVQKEEVKGEEKEGKEEERLW
ncbi:Anp1-domain-containing protein [Kalaharituber pfeilii]|nr:Anp1-domain-containing protein [Kalaharituber pfeilii]